MSTRGVPKGIALVPRYYGVGRGHGLEQLVLRQYRCRLRGLLV